MPLAAAGPQNPAWPVRGFAVPEEARSWHDLLLSARPLFGEQRLRLLRVAQTPVPSSWLEAKNLGPVFGGTRRAIHVRSVPRTPVVSY